MVNVFGQFIYYSNTQIASYSTKRVWPTHETLTKIQLRYTSCNQLIELLKQAGFKVLSIYGDHQKSEWTQKKSSIAVVCKQ